MHMRHFDLSPLYRSTVGFDRLFNMLDQASSFEPAPTYPPYNIERTAENAYRITIGGPPASPKASFRSNRARTP
jgi:molecular chaperone IbpA